MRLLTVNNDRVQFTFNVHGRINDDEILSESAFSKMVMMARTGGNRRLLISEGNITMYRNGHQYDLPENAKLQIIALTIEVNNVLVLGKHTMKGNIIYELEPDAIGTISSYLSFIINIMDHFSSEKMMIYN